MLHIYTQTEGQTDKAKLYRRIRAVWIVTYNRKHQSVLLPEDSMVGCRDY